MSHNLTQPEEIDLIWMAMANQMESDISGMDKVNLYGISRNTDCSDSEEQASAQNKTL